MMPRFGNILSMLLVGFLILAAAPAAATEPLPPEDPGDIRKTEERVGAFRLEFEEYRQTGPGAWNTPREWKKVRMIWRSADGLSEAVIEDDGYTLSRSYSVKSADGGSCMGGGGLSQYGAGSNSAAYKRAYLEFLKSCGAEPPRATAYGAELHRAFADYPAAGERLEALAVAAFGALAPRCIRFRQDLFPPMNRQCVRYSKPGAAR